MPATIDCQCGNSYDLKDEYAGRSVQCPNCATVNVVPKAIIAADPAFDRDKFLLRQKAMAIKEKYYVWDEQGNVILYVERPAHVLRSLLALITGLTAGAAIFMVTSMAAVAAGRGPAADGLIFVGVVAALVGFVLTASAVSAKRHVTFYRDDSKRERMLEVLQDQKLTLFTATFTVRDHQGRTLARFRKNYLYNVFRKQWRCTGPSGAIMCVAKEDSIILSLLRRFLGPLFGLLRTNFIILRGASDTLVGEFNRKLTLLDRYVLDLSRDTRGQMDRRVMLALGVMLDTGERR
jgi:uncharacterized protein YxjI